MKMDLQQVHMAPFGLIFIQDGSHKLWEASGMPPRPHNTSGKYFLKKQVFRAFPYFSVFSYIFLSSLTSDMPALFPSVGSAPGPTEAGQCGANIC